MNHKEKICLCTNCGTGQNTYWLDSHSEFCPYIHCNEDNNCPFYIPIMPTISKQVNKNKFFKKLIKKLKK